MSITPNWPAPTNIHAYTTTRLGGISTPPWNSFNLADHVGDAADAVAANRATLKERLNLPAAPCWMHQVHGNTVIHHDSSDGDHRDLIPNVTGKCGDATVTKKANQVCAVLTADCLPVLFCDRYGSCVGIAHAGWRGLIRGVLDATVDALDTDPTDLLAWLGPGIGPTAFEVGDEVRHAFVQAHTEAAPLFSGMGGRWFADLYGLARQRLQRLGIRNIYGGDFCTYCDAKYFFSYRRDGVTGRMATVIYFDTT